MACWFSARAAACVGLIVAAFAACAEDVAPVQFDPAAKPSKVLSAYHFFLDNQKQIPNDRVVPYDLNTPLFSDYAAKHRFIWMPPGVSGKYDPENAFDLPVGTVLIKTFSFLHDLRDESKGERIVETRLLVHKPEGWVGWPYIWNADVTEAKLSVIGGTADVTWTHTDGKPRTINYIIPNMNQCKQCHENKGVMMPIGPKARNLNRDIDYGAGKENQLLHWMKVGYLTGAPDDPAQAPRAAVWDDPASGSVDRRARAWLDVNCAHCHNPNGPAYTSGLDLSYHQEIPERIGVLKPPVAAGRGSGDLKFGIVPGDPDHSILVHRIESTEPGIMMPQLPRRVVHEEGVALIREWISGMKQ